MLRAVRLLLLYAHIGLEKRVCLVTVTYSETPHVCFFELDTAMAVFLFGNP